MTPEVKAVTERARKAYDDLFAAYGVLDDGSDEAVSTLHALVQTDLCTLANAIAQYADDDEPVTLEDIYRAARMHDLYIHYMGGQQYALRIVGKCVPIKTSSQLRALLKGLGK